MKKILAALLAAIAMASCSSHPGAEEALSLAEASVAMADTVAARSLCAELADTAQYSLTPSQLCRQAMVHARLSELCENSDDMAAAVKCYTQALAISPDSVRVFETSQPVSAQASMRMIRDLAQAVEAPGEELLKQADEWTAEENASADEP